MEEIHNDNTKKTLVEKSVVKYSVLSKPDIWENVYNPDILEKVHETNERDKKNTLEAFSVVKHSVLPKPVKWSEINEANNISEERPINHNRFLVLLYVCFGVIVVVFTLLIIFKRPVKSTKNKQTTHIETLKNNQ